MSLHNENNFLNRKINEILVKAGFEIDLKEEES